MEQEMTILPPGTKAYYYRKTKPRKRVDCVILDDMGERFVKVQTCFTKVNVARKSLHLIIPETDKRH